MGHGCCTMRPGPARSRLPAAAAAAARRLPQLLLAAALALLLAAQPSDAQGALAPQYSSLWGVNGELWTPTGRLADWSYAGARAACMRIGAAPTGATQLGAARCRVAVPPSLREQWTRAAGYGAGCLPGPDARGRCAGALLPPAAAQLAAPRLAHCDAGYSAGERPIPRYPVAFNVRDFGAKGDNVAGG